jgi:hypothetical protein
LIAHGQNPAPPAKSDFSDRLYRKESARWKISVLPLASKTLNYNVSAADEKPMVIAQTIFRYNTRQMEPAQAAGAGAVSAMVDESES